MRGDSEMMFSAKRIACTVVALCAIIVGVSAASAEEGVHLDPASVKDMVIEQSFGVKQVEMDRAAAAEVIPTAKGIFDTFLSGSAGYQMNKEKQINPIFGTRTDTVQWNLGLQKELSPTGTTLGLSLDSEWTKTSGSFQVGGNPIIPSFGRYEPVLGITLQQPLMKNAFGMNDRGGVQEARHAYASADQAVRYEIDKLVYLALQDYWRLFFIREHMKAIDRAVSFAREFLNTAFEERKLGTAEETDVLAARANLLGRQNEYSAYKELEEVAEEALRNDLELDPDQALLLSSRYPPKVRHLESVESMISRAMANRGDYLAAIEEIERQRVRVKMARNSRWPQLDLVSTLDLNEIDRSYGDALGDMDSPNLTAGLMLSVPLENRAARAGARKAEAERARTVYAAKDLEKKIANEIARLAVAIGERLTIVEQTQQALSLHLEKQKLELGKYRMGRSSSDLVKRYQDDTVDTQRNLFEAWLAYKKSILDLKFALGMMVAESGEISEQTEVGK